MTVLGSANIVLKTKTKTVHTQALVTTNLAHPVLLSWHDLIGLGIITNSFPSPVALSADSSLEETRLVSEILDNFPSVFKDSLGEQPMSTEEVHLHLRPNATPFRVSANRPRPV